MRLTAKKRAFIENYKLTRNAYKSCLVAGFSPRNALSYGSKLLKQPEVSKIIHDWEEEERKQIEAKIIERKALLHPDKGTYLERTFLKAEQTQHAPTAAKYWELGGKVSGFISDGENRGDINIFQVIAGDLKLLHSPTNGQISDQNDRNSANTPNNPPIIDVVSDDVSRTYDDNVS